jgi:hypothetical protein
MSTIPASYSQGNILSSMKAISKDLGNLKRAERTMRSRAARARKAG